MAKIASFAVLLGLFFWFCVVAAVHAEFNPATNANVTLPEQETNEEGDTLQPARILTPAQHFTKLAGEHIVFPCEIDNANSGVVMWTKETKLLTSGNRRISRNRHLALDISPDQRFYNLVLTMAGRNDNGNYSCLVMQADRELIKVVHTVIVHYPPVVDLPPRQVIEIRESDSLTLDCVASGNPKPFIRWIFKADNGDTRPVHDIGRPYMQIENFASSDVGEYNCVADNGIGDPVKSQPIRVDMALPRNGVVVVAQSGRFTFHHPDNVPQLNPPMQYTGDGVSGIAASCSDQGIYWANEKENTIDKVQYFPVYGNALGYGGSPLLRNVTVTAMTADPATGSLFWANSQSISVADLSDFGAGYKTIIDGQNMDVRAMAVHPSQQLLFWINGNAIETAHVNGSGRRTFANIGFQPHHALAVDEDNDEICWINAEKLECAALDGSNRRKLLTTLSDPALTRIAMHQGRLYFTEDTVDSSEYWPEYKYAIKRVNVQCDPGSCIPTPVAAIYAEKPRGMVFLSEQCPFYCAQPNITTKALNLTRVRGQSVLLPCKIQKADSGTIVWSKGSEVLYNGTTKIITRPDIQFTVSRNGRFHNLVIGQLRIEDQGTYTCHIHATPANVTHTLAVNYPPTADLQPRTITVDATSKSNVSLTCIAEGQPSPVVKWIFTNEYGAATDLPMLLGQHTINITHLDRADSGKYRCTADNGIGPTVLSPIARIVVTFAPEVAEAKKVLVTQIGRTVSMSCVFQASPPGEITVSWFRSNQTDGELIAIAMDDRYRFESNVLGPKIETLLWIHNVQEPDLGKYICLFKNEQGKVQRNAYLTDRAQVTHISVVYIPEQLLQKRILITVESASPVKQYRLAYRAVNQTHEGPIKEETIVSKIGDLIQETGSAEIYRRSHVLENLHPGTSYVLKVAVENAKGWNLFADTYSFGVPETSH